jgi:hypothetical protein
MSSFVFSGDSFEIIGHVNSNLILIVIDVRFFRCDDIDDVDETTTPQSQHFFFFCRVIFRLRSSLNQISFLCHQQKALGAEGCGKSSLLNRFFHGSSEGLSSSSSSSNRLTKKVTVGENKSVTLEAHDSEDQV